MYFQLPKLEEEKKNPIRPAVYTALLAVYFKHTLREPLKL